jgi:signal transduction histidine kinase
MMTDAEAVDIQGREPSLDRALMRLGIHDDAARIVAATPALRASWLIAASIATLFAISGEHADPRMLTVLLVLAPVLPVAGVAAAYGPWSDPMYEVTQATPASGFRVLLLRSIAVLSAAGVLVTAAALALPGAGPTAVAWVLPALGLCAASLTLATFVPLRQAALLVIGTWLVLAAGVGIVGSATSLFRGWAQVVFFAITVSCSFVVARRRQHLEIANLHSRRALLDAADNERRRIERNIHDGAQQQLVAIGVKAGLARSLVANDPDKAIEIMDQVRAEAQSALASLRDMTRGAYPPILADDGLAAALISKAKAAPIHVTVNAGEVGRLPKPVEIATYFCCTESIQNAAKHSQASAVVITLRSRMGALTFSVVDDGEGFDPSGIRRGVGMRSMLERVESLGGTLEVQSEVGRGTAISATIPVHTAFD